MLNAILSFFVFFILFFFGMKTVHRMTKKQMWSLTRYSLYGIVCSVLAVIVLTGLVLIF